MEQKRYSGLQKAIRLIGTDNLAGALGVAPSTVRRWLREDGTPIGTESKPADNAVGRAVALAGSQVALARELGVTYQAVANWQRLGYVPPQRAQQIENTYGIPRAELVSPKLRSAMGIGGEL